jgi:hypothetical protein
MTHAVLSKENLVSVGSAVVVCVAILGGYDRYNKQVAVLEDGIRQAQREAMSANQAAARASVDLQAFEKTSSGNRWTCSDQEKFILRLQVANPPLRVPSVGKRCSSEDTEVR